jgi:hypothetical protein
VGFREYGPGQFFSNPYEQQGFSFIVETGPEQWETIALEDMSGLKIESVGLRVDLPMGTDRAMIQAAVPTGSSELIIKAIGDQKNTLHEAIIPGDATLHKVTITRDQADIFHVTLNGGDESAILIEVCIDER